MGTVSRKTLACATDYLDCQILLDNFSSFPSQNSHA